MVQKNEMKRKEKILKELEKKYEIEKNKTSKLDTNLKSTEEELKVTRKVQYNAKLVHSTVKNGYSEHAFNELTFHSPWLYYIF